MPYAPATQAVTIRHTRPSDLPRLQEIFAIARRFMAANGNPHQWAEDYPSKELLLRDIDSGDSYVCEQDGTIVATFVLRGGEDSTYRVVYDGAWLDDGPYATIHRIASSGEVKGVVALAVGYALTRYTSLRIDTHADNSVMQHVIERAGFRYCGIIHCWNGSERLAYQYHPTAHSEI